MNDNNTFKETSFLFRPEFLIGMISGLGAVVLALVMAIREHDRWGIYIGAGAVAMTLGIFTLLFLIKLDLTIDNTGITFTYFPNKRTPVHYSWAEIETVQLLTINPLSEFLGWGKKKSRNYGWGYLTRGNHILYIRFRNGDKLSFTIVDKKKAAHYLPADKTV